MDSSEETQTGGRPAGSPGQNQPSPDGGTSASAPAAKRKALPTVLVVAAGVLIALVIVGVAAAALLPTVGASAQTGLGSMLPATTVGYMAVDLNPSGATQANLNRIANAFTSQPGWSGSFLATELRAKSHPQASGCTATTLKKVEDDFHLLGHQTAFAFTSTAGINLSRLANLSSLPGVNSSLAAQHSAVSSLPDDFVVVAPLHIQESLFSALTSTGVSFAKQTKVGAHAGVTIYSERATGCGTVRNTARPFFAAEDKGWLLFGLVPQALYPVIDTADGSRPNLNSVSAYRQLMKRLPSNQLASDYVRGSAFKQIGLARLERELQSRLRGSGSSFRSANSLLNSSAGAVTVDQNGLALTSVSPGKALVNAASAGALAALLPAGTEVFFSDQGLKNLLHGVLTEAARLNRLGQITRFRNDMSYITANMSGETGFIFFQPAAPLNVHNPGSFPVSVMWKVNSDASASSNLDKLARNLGLDSRLTSGVYHDGTTFHQTSQGYGYAVRDGWAIVSSDIRGVLGILVGNQPTTLSSVPGYRRSVPTGATASSLWYVNVTGVRRTIETSSMLQLWKQTYDREYRPLLVPFHTISGSVGTLGPDRYVMLRVDIG